MRGDLKIYFVSEFHYETKSGPRQDAIPVLVLIKCRQLQAVVLLYSVEEAAANFGMGYCMMGFAMEYDKHAKALDKR